jgi:hypothetical protein
MEARGNRRLMQSVEAAKPATAWGSEPASNPEQLGRALSHLDTRDPTPIQAERLRRLYALTWATATTVAHLAYGVAQ